MEKRNRRRFIKTALTAGAGVILSSYQKTNVSKRIIINTQMPRRVFQEGREMHDIDLKEIQIDGSQNKIMFILSDSQTITYEYADSYQTISRLSKREGMKMKILFAYSLDKMCMDDKKNQQRNEACSGDLMQTQKFLETLSITKYAVLVLSFNIK